MATIKVTLDKRTDHKTKDNKCPLVLRIGHKSKTRDIPFNIHVKENHYDLATGKITGIQNAVRHTKRTRKIYSDVDLWIDENEGLIKNWDIARLKQEIEQVFFKKSPSRTILNHGAVYLNRLRLEGRYSTASSYEDALKILVKYARKLKKEDDKASIKTLYKTVDNILVLDEQFIPYDLEIKTLDYRYVHDFKAYMINRFPSKNTTNIYLRSLQAIMNDAGSTFPDLRNHKPLSGISKKSFANAPEPITLEDLNALRNLRLNPNTQIWHTRNYFLMMFNNMGMNFFDLALIKRFQFNDGRIKYFRKKTHYEGDYFSVLQSDEALKIIQHYLKDQNDDDYLFPIIPNGTIAEKIFKVKKGKTKTFNTYAMQLAKKAKIDKRITTYTPRDTWTNIGLDLGIDIRKISSGLGHSSVQVTEKHYGKTIEEKILDEVNAKITR